MDDLQMHPTSSLLPTETPSTNEGLHGTSTAFCSNDQFEPGNGALPPWSCRKSRSKNLPIFSKGSI